MQQLQLWRHVYELPVQTSQSRQAQVLISPSQIILFFEDHVQLWDFDIQKRISSSLISESIFYWSIPTHLTGNSFAFISLENCEAFLGTFDFSQNKIVKLCDLPSERYFRKLLYFQGSKEIFIDTMWTNHQLLIWNGKEIIEQKIDSECSVEKYSNNAISIFSTNKGVMKFQIQTGVKEIKEYAITGVEEGTIIIVQEYSPNYAIIALRYEEQATVVLLYELSTGQICRSEKIDFSVDGFIKMPGFWIAMCTPELEVKSSVQVQTCFGLGSNKSVEMPINRWIRNWNEFLPIVTLDPTYELQEKQLCRIEVVRCTKKASTYIKLMEDLGIIKQFGEEIIKATIANF